MQTTFLVSNLFHNVGISGAIYIKSTPLEPKDHREFKDVEIIGEFLEINMSFEG